MYDIIAKIVTKLKALPDLFSALVQKVDEASQAAGSALTASDIADNLTTSTSGKVLDASQGYALDQGKVNVTDIANNLTTSDAGKVLDASQGKALNDKIYLDFINAYYDEAVQTINFTGNPYGAYIVIACPYSAETPSAWLITCGAAADASAKIVKFANGTTTTEITSTSGIALTITTGTFTSVRIAHLHS